MADTICCQLYKEEHRNEMIYQTGMWPLLVLGAEQREREREKKQWRRAHGSRGPASQICLKDEKWSSDHSRTDALRSTMLQPTVPFE